MKLLYIAGPYGADCGFRIHMNIADAWDRAIDILRQKNKWFPVVPHLNTMHMDGARTRDEFLEGTLEIMRRCDGLLMAFNWQSSEGACKERNLALAMGIPVYYSIDEVPDE